MKSKKIFKIIHFLMLLLNGCNINEDKTDTQGAIVLSVNVNDSIRTEADFINTIDSIRFVVLKDNTIKDISKIVTYDSNYYVLDKIQHSISVLDYNGNLKYKLLKRGRSKQEYLEITDLSVSNQKIIIYDQLSMRIIEYHIHTGEYLNSFEVQDIYTNICQSDHDFLAAYCSYGLPNSSNKMLTLYHSNVILNYIDKPDFLNERINIEQNFPISQYINHIYLTPLFSNFVYCIESDTIKAKYYIDFGAHQISDNFYQNLNHENANKILHEIYHSDYAHSIEHFIETENYIYFIFAYKKDDYSVYYNKKTTQLSLYRKTSFGNNTKLWACNNHISNTNTEFISLLYLTNIPKEMNDTNSILKKLIDVTQEINEVYEFAIAIYKFK